jgi:hypothetical protein
MDVKFEFLNKIRRYFSLKIKVDPETSPEIITISESRTKHFTTRSTVKGNLSSGDHAITSAVLSFTNQHQIKLEDYRI